MRGHAATEPGEWDEKFEESEPAKYQSVCTPIEQIRMKNPLKPFRQRNDEFCKETLLEVTSIMQEANDNLIEYTQEFRTVPWFDYG